MVRRQHQGLGRFIPQTADVLAQQTRTSPLIAEVVTTCQQSLRGANHHLHILECFGIGGQCLLSQGTHLVIHLDMAQQAFDSAERDHGVAMAILGSISHQVFHGLSGHLLATALVDRFFKQTGNLLCRLGSRFGICVVGHSRSANLHVGHTCGCHLVSREADLTDGLMLHLHFLGVVLQMLQQILRATPLLIQRVVHLLGLIF